MTEVLYSPKIKPELPRARLEFPRSSAFPGTLRLECTKTVSGARQNWPEQSCFNGCRTVADKSVQLPTGSPKHHSRAARLDGPLQPLHKSIEFAAETTSAYLTNGESIAFQEFSINKVRRLVIRHKRHALTLSFQVPSRPA